MKSIHHSFDVDLASIYGVDCAILIHHFQHWISLNRKRKKNFIEGRTWTYQTIQEIADNFPYWSIEDVRAIIEKLCKGQGRRSKKTQKDFPPILIKGNFNRSSFDRTIWYAFVTESDFLNKLYDGEISQIQKGDLPNPKRSAPTPIPDTKTDTKKDLPPLPPTSKDTATPEEEEEISKRFKERPSDAPKIVSKKKWKESVLEDIRSDCGSKEDDLRRFHKHKEQIKQYDGRVLNGLNVYCYEDKVELTKGSYCCSVRYDTIQENWEKRTGFKDHEKPD